MPSSSQILRRAYLEWVEEQIENFKDSVSRADLLRIAEEAIEDMRVNRRGQYQLTEVLLCDAVDRRIFQLLKLPGYRAWSSTRRNGGRPDPTDTAPPLESHPAADPDVSN